MRLDKLKEGLNYYPCLGYFGYLGSDEVGFFVGLSFELFRDMDIPN